jgi:hypothetical protein
MTNPVPGYAITTPYGRRGSYWSCDRDSSGNGIHTGADYAAPAGAKVVAARDGTVAHVSYGSAFGYHQVAVRRPDGTEDFYAHMRSRVPHGTTVAVGSKVGEVGAEGNVTGAHLHFERHKGPGWSCALCVDPAPSINYQPAGSGGSGAGGKDDDPVPEYTHVYDSDGWTLGSDDWAPISWPQVQSDSSGAASKGNPGLDLGGSRYSATLLVSIEHNQGAAQVTTRTIEGQLDSAGRWEVTKTRPPQTNNVPSSGALHLSDTRHGSCAKGNKVRWQIKGRKGARVTSARLYVLWWK